MFVGEAVLEDGWDVPAGGWLEDALEKKSKALATFHGLKRDADISPATLSNMGNTQRVCLRWRWRSFFVCVLIKREILPHNRKARCGKRACSPTSVARLSADAPPYGIAYNFYLCSCNVQLQQHRSVTTLLCNSIVFPIHHL